MNLVGLIINLLLSENFKLCLKKLKLEASMLRKLKVKAYFFKEMEAMVYKNRQ